MFPVNLQKQSAVYIKLIPSFHQISPEFVPQKGGGSDTERETPVAPWPEEGEPLGVRKSLVFREKKTAFK